MHSPLTLHDTRCGTNEVQSGRPRVAHKTYIFMLQAFSSCFGRIFHTSLGFLANFSCSIQSRPKKSSLMLLQNPKTKYKKKVYLYNLYNKEENHNVLLIKLGESSSLRLYFLLSY